MKSIRTTALPSLTLALAVAASPLWAQQTASKAPAAGTATVPVTVKNFQRAESDLYFVRNVKLGGFGKFYHYRTMTPIEAQSVVRMNRDALYSGGIFDLDAGPVTITLPDTGKRFMSMLVINEDHYAPLVVYAPGTYTLTREEVGTRYVMAALRTFASPIDPADLKIANEMQDKVTVKQASVGRFEVPNWDPVSQDKIRETLEVLNTMSGATNEKRMGKKEEVDPILHLIATASGWGLNPLEAAVYNNVFPKANDGKTVHKLSVKDVPVDGFWSISIYNDKGYFEKNALDSYSINNVSAKPNADGSYTIQFGGCTKATPNCLVTPAKWSYQVRQYRPRKEIIDGSWKFPLAQPVR